MSDETPKEEPPKLRPATLAFNVPGSVSTLKKAYNFKLKMPDSKEFVAELNGESDRAAVILASSQLDDLLANAIALRMAASVDVLVGDVETIFRPSGPLGTFSARAEIANLFGVIENETYEQLTILREMRNACAHSKHPISFKDDLLRNVAMNLFAPRGSTPRAIAEKDVKAAFGLEISFLTSVLALGSRKAGYAARSEAFTEMIRETVEMLKASPGKRPGS
jgi:DNA-binding MltR family transcriptional regulator